MKSCKFCDEGWRYEPRLHAHAHPMGWQDCTLTETNQSTDFIECDECRAKCGTPSLCDSCISNRGLIENLKWKVESWRDVGLKDQERHTKTEKKRFWRRWL